MGTRRPSVDAKSVYVNDIRTFIITVRSIYNYIITTVVVYD